MDADTHQAGKIAVNDELIAKVRRIPGMVEQEVLLIKATGGFKYMTYFKASEMEVRAAAEKAISHMCGLRLRLLVAEDLLRNSRIIDRCFETYDERVKALVAELVRTGVVAAEKGK